MINLSKLIDFDKKKAILYIVSLESAVNDHLVGNTEIVIFLDVYYLKVQIILFKATLIKIRRPSPRAPHLQIPHYPWLIERVKLLSYI